jgi:hypothetical protein
MKYGPWISFNTGDTVPEGRGQIHIDGQSRAEAEKSVCLPFGDLVWTVKPHIQTIAYRSLIGPVRGEVVLYGGAVDGRNWIFGDVRAKADNHRLTLPTEGGKPICGDAVPCKIEVL